MASASYTTSRVAASRSRSSILTVTISRLCAPPSISPTYDVAQTIIRGLGDMVFRCTALLLPLEFTIALRQLGGNSDSSLYRSARLGCLACVASSL